MSHHAFTAIGGRERYRLPAPIGRGVVNLFNFGDDWRLVVGLEVREDLKCAIVHRPAPLARGDKRNGAEGLRRRRGHSLYAPEAGGRRAGHGILYMDVS